MRRIEVTVDPAGGVKIEALEFRGAECEKATRFLECALGAVKTRRRKPESLVQATGQPRLRVQL